MSLKYHYLTDINSISETQFLDMAPGGSAHLSPMSGASLIYATGQVKGNLDQVYWPTLIKGFAGYTAPEIKASWNAMSGTVPTVDTTCSLSFLMRVNVPTAGTIMRWESGSYIYMSAAGELSLEGPSAFVICNLTELGGVPNIWHRITMVRTGTTFLVYIDDTYIREVARTFNMTAGVFNLGAYQSTRSSPSGADVKDIRGYNHQLSLAEIQALVAADGANPVNWNYYHPTGSDLGVGGLHGENGLLAGGYTGYTNYAIANPGPKPMVKIWTNNDSCRYGKTYWVGSKTKLYTEFEFYIPITTIFEQNHSAPSSQFMFIQFQKTAYVTDIPTNYICLITGIWEDPGEGARLRRYRITWYDSGGSAHAVDLPDADIPTDQLFTVKCNIELNDASSIIDVSINGVAFDTVTADFTGISAIGCVGAGPYNGVHQAIESGSDSYPIYMGKQYIGDIELNSVCMPKMVCYYNMLRGA